MSGEENSAKNRGSLKSRVEGFVNADDASVEFIRECLWRILDRIEQLAKLIRRSVIGIVLLAVLFELLNRNLVSEASAGGVKLAKLNFLKPFIPVAIGYMWMRIAALYREGAVLVEVYFHIIETKFPYLYSSAIDVLMISAITPTAAEIPSDYVKFSGVISFTQGAEGNIYVGLPAAFSVYAFIQLFRSSGISDVTIWLSCALTILLLVCGFIYYFSGERA